jgi:hypothetical protein
MSLPTFFFFFKIILAILGTWNSLWILGFPFCNDVLRTLVRITLNLYIALGSIAILTNLNLLVHAIGYLSIC